MPAVCVPSNRAVYETAPGVVFHDTLMLFWLVLSSVRPVGVAGAGMASVVTLRSAVNALAPSVLTAATAMA